MKILYPLSSLFACLFAVISASSAERPNVLLILTDNQSFFELSCHGHADVETPHIDKLASQSVDFMNFHAPPFCSPSRAELLTGRYALRSGVHDTVGGVSILNQQETTLANYLSGVGYRTAIFGKWHLGITYPYHPMYRGFQKAFIHGGGGIGQMEDYYGNDHFDAVWDDNGVMEPSKGFSTDVLFGEAAKFIGANKDNPFFCFISTPATHTPYQAEPRALERIKARGVEADDASMKLYSMIENIDENVGQLMEKLDKWDLSRNTLVIFATDQGIQDRGAPNPRNTERRPAHGSAFDPKHQVFCMMRYPSVTKPHQNHALAGMVDVAPTILDVCGITPLSSLDGRSLRPLLEGAADWPDERFLIIQCPRTRYRGKWENASIKTQDWRLVGGDQLYAIAEDRDQLNNVAEQFPDVVVELSAQYENFWNSLPPAYELLSRQLLGTPESPETRLVCMDWYRGAHPWHQLHLARGKSNGVWPVDVTRAGKYRFELRSYPREAPTSIGATHASIRIGPVFQQSELADSADKAIFELDLKEGQYDLETAFKLPAEAGQKDSWGAYFVYLSYMGK